MREAVFRFDASPQIGGGHAYRCMVVARALERCGYVCSFAIGPESVATIPALARSGNRLLTLPTSAAEEPAALQSQLPDRGCCLIVDHYQRGIEFEQACRSWSRYIAVIDDAPGRAHDADLLVDQTLGRRDDEYAQHVPSSARVLTGPRYALLREQFAQQRPDAIAARRRGGSSWRIFVSVGASDPTDLTTTALEGLETIETRLGIDVLAGASWAGLDKLRGMAARSRHEVKLHCGTDDVASLMAAADMAIGAAGTTSWERCALGLPAAVIVAAENQRENATRLQAAGAIVVLGDALAITARDITDAISVLLVEPYRLRAMSDAAATLCDGRGAERVAAWFERLEE